MSSGCVFDVEADGFYSFVENLLCIVGYDLETEAIQAFHDTDLYPRHGTLLEGIEYLASFDVRIGHNIRSYDLPVLDKLEPGYDFVEKPCVDTQKLGELLFPEMKKQGIEEWVRVLNLPDPKIKVSDFSYLSQKLLDRCVGDVKNNVAIYKYLLSRKRQEERDGNSFNPAIKLEHEVARLHSYQEIHGVYYNIDLALKTSDEFKNRMDELEGKVRDLAPPLLSISGMTVEGQKTLRSTCLNPGFKDYNTGQEPFKKSKFDKTVVIDPFTKTGKIKAHVRSYFGERDPRIAGEFCKVTFEISDLYNANAISYFGEDYIRKVQGPYSKIEINPINCSSDPQVKDFMLSIGWVPIEYNYSKKTGERTSPKLTEDSYKSLPEGLGQDIAEFRILQHRRSLIFNESDPEKGALGKVRDDHRVPAEAFTCGTPTARYRHKGAVNLKLAAVKPL